MMHTKLATVVQQPLNPEGAQVIVQRKVNTDSFTSDAVSSARKENEGDAHASTSFSDAAGGIADR